MAPSLISQWMAPGGACDGAEAVHHFPLPRVDKGRLIRAMRLVPRARSAARVAAQSTGLLVVLTAVVFFSGCSNKYLYYQTRYVPTSSEESFAPSARAFWTENDEVYELPSNPPALASVDGEDDHRARIDCAPPGPSFKSSKIAAYGPGLPPGRGEVDASQMAILANPTGIPPAPKGREPGPLGGWTDDRRFGPNEPRPVSDIAQMDQGPHVPRHTDTAISANPLAGTGPDNSWCPPAK